MNNNFSFNRVAFLLQRYFLENFNREIMQWGFIVFLFTALDHRNFVLAILFLSGIVSTKRIHKAFFKSEKGLHLLLLPAKRSEKITAAFLLNTIYHFAVVVAAYAIGNLLVTIMYHYIVKMQIPVNWDLFIETTVKTTKGIPETEVSNVFWPILGYFALSQSIFTLGNLYFPKFPVVKTIFTICGTFGFLFLIQVIMFRTVWDVKHLSNAFIPTIIMIRDSTLPQFGKDIISYGPYLVFPLIWVVSYLRLVEKQE